MLRKAQSYGPSWISRNGSGASGGYLELLGTYHNTECAYSAGREYNRVLRPLQRRSYLVPAFPRPRVGVANAETATFSNSFRQSYPSSSHVLLYRCRIFFNPSARICFFNLSLSGPEESGRIKDIKGPGELNHRRNLQSHEGGAALPSPHFPGGRALQAQTNSATRLSQWEHPSRPKSTRRGRRTTMPVRRIHLAASRCDIAILICYGGFASNSPKYV